MKYLCLVYLEEKKLDSLTKSEADALADESLAYDEELRKNGHYIASAALQRVHAATTIRKRNGRVSATDGPFAETKEQLGGFILIDARDLDEAMRIAGRVTNCSPRRSSSAAISKGWPSGAARCRRAAR